MRRIHLMLWSVISRNVKQFSERSELLFKEFKQCKEVTCNFRQTCLLMCLENYKNLLLLVHLLSMFLCNLLLI